jgi:peptide/nickel transport system permease protein
LGFYAPGDPLKIQFDQQQYQTDPVILARLRHLYGLDRPFWVQFGDYIWSLARGDWGESLTQGTEGVWPQVKRTFPVTFQIGAAATLLLVVVGIPMGVVAAVKQNTWIDYVVRAFSIAGIGIPSFWLGIMVILGLLIVTQAWFGAGWMPPITYVSPFEDPLGNLAQLIWPALATGYRYSAVATRMTRSAMLEVLREDYVRTARAKGLIERAVINRHALKNALLPVVTIITIEFAFLMGGLVVTEQVFNLNGLGKLFVDSVGNQDFALTQHLVMLVVLFFLATNLVVDIFYAWLDPRIRYS